jgi:PAS domain S-box-containing protein
MARSLAPKTPPVAKQPGPDGAEAPEIVELRAQLHEAHETIEAIRRGAVDSLVIGPPGQEQVYTLASADRTYRLIMEAMSEGAATISPRGVILDVNPRLCVMTGQSVTQLTGASVLSLVPAASRPELSRLLDLGPGGSTRGEVDLNGPYGTTVPVLLAVGGFDLDGMLLRCLVLSDLTAQRAAEGRAAQAHEALREQNAFLEQAQEVLGLGWWKLDPVPEGILSWSAATYRIFALTPAEFDGKWETFLRLVHPDDAPGVSAALASALRSSSAPYQVEHRIIRPDGGVRWVQQSGVVERDEAGARRMLGICQDITDRKRIEEENRVAAAYNRSVIEASLDPLVMIGPQGAITDVNTATERATGYSRAELLGTEFSDYFTEADTARAVYEQAFGGGEVRDHPLELRHRGGRTTSVLYNASVYREPSGRVLGVFAAARDITQMRRAQAALRESEEWLRAVFDNAPVGIEDLSPSGEFVRVNPRFCQITGYTADELRSRRINDITHPDDLAATLASLQRLISGEIDADSVEKRYSRKDGEVVWAEVNSAVVRDPDGNPILIVGVARDLTAQRVAESEVRALNAGLEARVAQRTADLEQANRNLEAFTYSASHDLRAPLRALSGYSEVLLEDYGDRLDEAGRAQLSRIQAASEQMGGLIDDLLQLSRVSLSQLNLEPLDLSVEVADIVAELQFHDPSRQVRFAIQEGVWVMGDRGLMRTVLQNLIENAWKFTAKRDDAIIEFASTAAEDAGVCCYVRDNGAGFDPAYADKLFKPFQRLHDTIEFPGTGIGLASVERIVRRHGGHVWADGATGGGATFYFTLNPAQHADAQPFPGQTPALSPADLS